MRDKSPKLTLIHKKKGRAVGNLPAKGWLMIVRRDAEKFIVFLILIGASLFLAVTASAQLPTGTILGVIKDSSGAIVPGATVTVQSTETDLTRKAVTDAGGGYRIPALPVGHYDVK